MLSIVISEKQFAKYGLSKENFDFDEFVKLLKKDIAKESLRKCREIAGKSPLTNMTLDEINAEVAAARQYFS